MTEKVFDRETVLDLTVNMIPLALLAFFFLMYIVVNPFGDELVIVTIQLGIVGMTFVGLAAVTYYSGAAVSKAESAAEAAAEAAEADDVDDAAENDEAAETASGDAA